jgi:glycyl-tRNA synthetase
MLDKVGRIQGLVELLAPELNLDHARAVNAMRAAYLSKADLVTRMVVEMTSLQGVMGREYALKSGESEVVANAIYEHYLPRYAGDNIPASLEGLLIGISDRLDTLMGLFGIGLVPSGTSDPYALRRTAIGLIQCLVRSATPFNLERGLRLANEQLGTTVSDQAVLECLNFIRSRQRALLLGDGIPHDVADAVLAEQGTNPFGVVRGTAELKVWTERSDWLEVLQAYSRCARITRTQEIDSQFDPEFLIEEASKGLYRALQTAEKNRGEPTSIQDFFSAFMPMIPAIDQFFDEVLVMAEDERLKSNRLNLLQRIVILAKGAADLSLLEGF